MLTQWLKVIVLSFCVLSIGALESGCTTMADAQAAKGHGIAKVYNASYDMVWDTTLAILNNVQDVSTDRYSNRKIPMGAHFKIVSADNSTGLILAKGGMTSFSWGENVAIYIESIEPTRTRVEIINKPALKTNVTSPDWDVLLFNDLDRRFAGTLQH